MEDDEHVSTQYPFDLDMKGYKKIVRNIFYMLIEKVNVFQCCVSFDRQFFITFQFLVQLNILNVTVKLLYLQTRHLY